MREGFYFLKSGVGLKIFILYILAIFIFNSGLEGIIIHHVDFVEEIPYDVAISTNLGILLFMILFGLIFAVTLVYYGVKKAYDMDRDFSDSFTVNPALIILKYFIGSIIIFILTALGLILLVIPGIFIFTSFALYFVVLIEEETGLINSFKESLRLMKGNRFRMLGLLVVMFVILFLISLPFELLFFLYDLEFVAGIMLLIPSSLGGVWGIGSFVSVYKQLK